MSNSSSGISTKLSWTYFLLDIPPGAAGGNIHIRMAADTGISYGIYVRYGGLPTDDNWDYFYANMTSNSNGSMFFKLYDAKEEAISFYILYVRGGTWAFGLKQVGTAGNASKSQTTMSISLERCPKRCSSHASALVIVTMEDLTVVLKLYHIEGTYGNQFPLLHPMLLLCFLLIMRFDRRHLRSGCSILLAEFPVDYIMHVM